jgi:hypothetical protein
MRLDTERPTTVGAVKAAAHGFGLRARTTEVEAEGEGFEPSLNETAHNGVRECGCELEPGSRPLPPQSEHVDRRAAHAHEGRAERADR